MLAELQSPQMSFKTLRKKILADPPTHALLGFSFLIPSSSIPKFLLPSVVSSENPNPSPQGRQSFNWFSLSPGGVQVNNLHSNNPHRWAKNFG